MTIHIFNPEHDLALAANLANFTAPRAARFLRRDLGFLPALWAAEGDVVLVDNEAEAELAYKKVALAAEKLLGRQLSQTPLWISTMKPSTLTGGSSTTKPSPLTSRLSPAMSSALITQADGVEPWGWDAALCARLHRLRVNDELLPSGEQLSRLRLLSHRRTAALLLPLLREDGVGQVFTVPTECKTTETVTDALSRYGKAVLKAPWSSSGRGIRFVTLSDLTPQHASEPALQATGADSLSGWLRNVLAQQGSVMVEPYYNKVLDFGMEFVAQADGSLSYSGLSLFHTQNGAYTGNILATEKRKREMMSRYIPTDLLDKVKESICRRLPQLLLSDYTGPLGIDMMLCQPTEKPGTAAPGTLLLHPCVEINLRRTMGHVALALSPTSDALTGVMRIHCSQGSYALTIEKAT